MAMADLGADVIKVEAPKVGDYLRQMPPRRGSMSGRFLSVNRGKRSVALDLKDEAGLGAFLRMVESSDVVVESFRPGVMQRLGLSYQTLREHRSDIILCSISGYGQTGPYRARAGHDLNYVGTAGVLAMGGERDAMPAMPGAQTADLAGGALWGLSAILAALVGRSSGQGGAHLDISMTEGALALLAAELGNLACLATAPSRGTSTLNGALACYRVYKTKDDRYLSVGALEPKFWIAFNQAIGRAGNPTEIIADADGQEAIAAEIQSFLIQKTRDEWAEIFARVDCCADAVLEIDELEHHPLHAAREVFFEMETDDGPALQVRLPIGDGKNARQPPRLGQHTAVVLGEMGFTTAEIDALS